MESERKLICRYCGKEVTRLYARNTCKKCHEKVYVLPKFVKARDDLREKLGLERLGADYER